MMQINLKQNNGWCRDMGKLLCYFVILRNTQLHNH